MPVNTTFSATPTFTWDRGDPLTFVLVLTGNVTSSTFDMTIAAPRGAHFKFVIIQDAVGGWTFAWPGICKGALPVGGAAKQITVQTFILLDGPVLVAAGLPAVF
jgi:hypothetical protein